MGNDQGNQGIRRFWELGARSDEQILGGVRGLLGTERHVTARLLAHLNEVAERRLHLKQAHSSMFEYCLELGMSEDEAGRRLCAAGVAKRFPSVYALVDSGKLSLSVVCKLKHYLSEENHAELLAGVSGLSFRKTEAWLAARFVRPDVPSTVRKLPTRTAPSVPVTQPSAATPAAVENEELQPARETIAPETIAPETIPADRAAIQTEGPQPSAETIAATVVKQWVPTTPPYPRRSDRGITEPLSSERYRIQFTASESLKEKLELARDLMAHRNPTGDFAPIIEKALDLLIDEIKKQRFGQTQSSARKRSTEKRPAQNASAQKQPATTRPATTRPATERSAQERSAQERSAQEPPHAKRERITNATRREVIERDGLRCSFVDEHGRRCKARAFLELEHREPWAKGGSSGAKNIRFCCRAHNKLLAELEYGREHVERAVAQRRATSPATTGSSDGNRMPPPSSARPP